MVHTKRRHFLDKFLWPFLLYSEICFVVSFSFRNCLLTGSNSLAANRFYSMFLKLTLPTKQNTPYERVWETVRRWYLFLCSIWFYVIWAFLQDVQILFILIKQKKSALPSKAVVMVGKALANSPIDPSRFPITWCNLSTDGFFWWVKIAWSWPLKFWGRRAQADPHQRARDTRHSLAIGGKSRIFK